MKRSLFAAIAAIGLVGGLGAATSANALVFAVFNPVSGSSGGVSNFSEDGMGHLTSTPATSAPTVFTFELSPLAAFGDLQSTFDFSASNATGATTGSIGGVSYVSAPYTGTFDYFYSGPTVTRGGVTLTPGELLLGGTFTDAVFTARVGANGGALTDDSIVGTVVYTSQLPSSALPLASTGQSFTIGFLDISPVAALQNGFIRHFTAVGDGKFSADMTNGGGGGGVPEPATWALMIAGVGGIGVCLRRRERLASTAA